MVLLPTPPFPLATATTFRTLGIGRFTGGPPLVGILGGILSPERGNPYQKGTGVLSVRLSTKTSSRVVPEDSSATRPLTSSEGAWRSNVIPAPFEEYLVWRYMSDERAAEDGELAFSFSGNFGTATSKHT